MLSENLAEVLAFVKSSPHGKAYRSELLLRVDSESTLSLLVQRGLLKSAFLDSDPFYRLTPEGEQTLIDWRSAAEEARRKHSEQEAKQDLKDQLEDKRWRKDARRSWVQWTITTILSVLSFFAGAIAEVFTGFMEWVLTLFH